MNQDSLIQVPVNYSVSSAIGPFRRLVQVGIIVIFQLHMPPNGSQRLVASCVFVRFGAAVNGQSSAANFLEFP